MNWKFTFYFYFESKFVLHKMSMDAKNKLFGNLAKSEDEVRANTTTVPKPVSKTAGMDLAALMGGASIGSSVSPDIKENHIKDALAAVKSAERALVTSLFQWSPDYTCAAPMYERASSCYHSAEDYPNEIKYMLKCAECHEKNGGYSSSAFAYSKAGNIAQQNKKHKDSMKYFMLSAEQWGLSGDLNKYADFYAKAGLEGAVAGENSKSITMCFQKAMKIALPANLSSADQLKSVHPQVFDMSRRIFNYYVSQSDLIREAIALGAYVDGF